MGGIIIDLFEQDPNHGNWICRGCGGPHEVLSWERNPGSTSLCRNRCAWSDLARAFIILLDDFKNRPRCKDEEYRGDYDL